ncbi:hypothetical protein CLAFUR4_08656 [Fulvia fulva]|nr:hypothetical protein CLAFUR4_08656 [Fulvia fulva]WPV27508.1 hypothetical protein CLAFUW7_08651 [Fulvia fulva]
MAAASSSILCLPAELLHRVFMHLDNSEVLAARRTCTMMAEVGKEHVLRTIVGTYSQKRLLHLVAASEHPYFSQRIKELHFQADIYHEQSPFLEWKENIKTCWKSEGPTRGRRFHSTLAEKLAWTEYRKRVLARQVQGEYDEQELLQSYHK